MPNAQNGWGMSMLFNLTCLRELPDELSISGWISDYEILQNVFGVNKLTAPFCPAWCQPLMPNFPNWSLCAEAPRGHLITVAHLPRGSVSINGRSIQRCLCVNCSLHSTGLRGRLKSAAECKGNTDLWNTPLPRPVLGVYTSLVLVNFLPSHPTVMGRRAGNSQWLLLLFWDAF